MQILIILRVYLPKKTYSLKSNGVIIHVFFKINIYLNVAWSTKIDSYTIFHLEQLLPGRVQTQQAFLDSEFMVGNNIVHIKLQAAIMRRYLLN